MIPDQNLQKSSDGPSQFAGKIEPSSLSLRVEFLGWTLLVIFLVVTFIVTFGRAPTWEDEVFVQSTAWSMVHGGQPNLSVLAMYPHTISPERFYGPVSFQVAATLLRVFGLQTWPWRAVCFLFGISLMVLSSALILRFTGANPWVVLAGAWVVATSSVYSSLHPGRWDPVTIGLVLSGIALLMHAVTASWKRLAWQACGAGIFFGLAVGSTPRAFPPMAGVVLGVLVAAYLDVGNRSRLMVVSVISGVSAFLVDAALLAPIGMTPWSWFRFVSTSSKGDRINSSPVLGGSWGLNLASTKVVIILAIAMLTLGLICAIRERRADQNSRITWKIAWTVIALATMAFEALLVSRALTTSIFWLPFLAISSFCWIDSEFPRDSSAGILIGTILCLELLLPGVMEVTRMVTAVKLWRSRDSRILLSQLKDDIPPRSIVFGPIGGYFFPVEQSGSRYLYLQEETTPGLSSGVDSSAYRLRSLDVAACTALTFVVWPREQEGDPMPDELSKNPKTLLHPEEADSRSSLVIYRWWGPRDCASTAPADAITAFGPP